MRVIVLGSKGQLGSDVSAVLEADGVEVVQLTREQFDVTSENRNEQLKLLPSADYVVNCSAFVNVDAAEIQCAEAFEVNAAFPYSLARYCQQASAKLIHISTDFVFRGDLGRAYLETDATAPLNIYGLSKAAGELAIQGSCADHFILRVAGLYGAAGSRSKGGNFVETMIRHAKVNGFLQVVDDQFTSPTHTMDVARAVLAIARKPSVAPGIYHCANKGVCSWYEFACEIIKQARIPTDIRTIRFSDLTPKAPRPKFSALHTEKLDAVYEMPVWSKALREYMGRTQA